MLTHPARARELLREKKAKVVRRYPFTIRLTKSIGGYTQPLELKFDPGSKTTGTAVVLHGKTQSKVVWAANLEHRGSEIVKAMMQRKNVRRSRRYCKTRYFFEMKIPFGNFDRKARFLNRKRPKGWLPPSVKSCGDKRSHRVFKHDHILNLARKLLSKAPLTHIVIEQNKFDMQLFSKP